MKKIIELPNDEEEYKLFLIKLQKFVGLLNRKVRESELQERNGGLYLPISFVEMQLDTIFFGLWSTKNFTFQHIHNELCGSIELVVIHPRLGIPITKTGAAAVDIPMKAKSTFSDYPANKQINGLEGAFPTLKAMCLKNAALSLGKFFGRDVNRRGSDNYTPMLREEDEIETLTEEIRKKVKALKTVDEINAFFTKYKKLQFDEDFITVCTEQRKTIEGE